MIAGQRSLIPSRPDPIACCTLMEPATAANVCRHADPTRFRTHETDIERIVATAEAHDPGRRALHTNGIRSSESRSAFGGGSGSRSPTWSGRNDEIEEEP